MKSHFIWIGAVVLVGIAVWGLPEGSSEAALPINSSYDMNVLVLKYFPLDQSGQNIDINVTGDVGSPYSEVRQHTIAVTSNLRQDLELASSYREYTDASAQPALRYHVVDTLEYTEAFPIKSGTSNEPDYFNALTDNDVCDHVTQQDVSEVWIWAYQGPGPELAISESKMSGPFGDISNSYRLNDMPYCGQTYRVYTFNYGRGTSEAMESWGHQMEAEVDAINSDFFRNRFQGPAHPQTLGVNGRCGSVHNPPNARFEYDRGNPTPQMSDCLDWTPDGLGTLSQISCQNWGCADNSDSDNSSLNYQIWNWQNLPGMNNPKTYQGRQLRNLWDIHGDFDNAMGVHPTIFTDEPTSSPTPSPSPTVGPCALASDMAELNANDWSAWAEGSTAGNTYVLDDSSLKIAGAGSLKFTTDGGFDTYVSYPEASGAVWDLSDSNYLRISFYAQNPSIYGFQNGSPWIRLEGAGNSYFQYQYYQNGNVHELLNEARGEWKAYLIPLDASETEDNGWRRTGLGNPSLTHVEQVEIHSDTWDFGFSLWVDGVCFQPPADLTTQTATPATSTTATVTPTAPTNSITPTPTPTANDSATPTPTPPVVTPPADSRGDTDCDGQINGGDVVNVLRDVGDIVLMSLCGDNGDVDRDGFITATDGLWILLFWSGLVSEFPN